jgi:protocatechuate 3,4-dioxygenase beta subunit
VERRPESTDLRASSARRATVSHEGAPRCRRWWLWPTLLAGLLLAAGLLPARVFEGEPHGSHASGSPSVLASVGQLLGLVPAPERPLQPTTAGGEPLASGNALRGANDALGGSSSTRTPAPGGAGTSLAALASDAASGSAASAAPPFGDDTPRDARITGSVLDATGGPIGGARVRVHFEGVALARYQRSGRLGVSPAPDDEWITDPEGHFEGLAPAGGIGLVASADAYTETRKRARAPAHDIMIVLAPASRVSGRVQRSDGSPVSGASLEIKPRAMDRPPLEGTSDARGEFSIGGVPGGVVEVTASAAGLSSAHEWLHLALAEVSAPIVLTLTEAHSLHGVVRAPDGSPCTAGMLRAAGHLEQMANIEANGDYRLDGLDDGTHELSATCHGVGTQTRSIHLAADSPPSLELNWQLDLGFAVTGSVRRKNGEPYAGAMVMPFGAAAPDGTSSASDRDVLANTIGTRCVSDAAGEFECGGLRPGWYRINAESGSGSSATSGAVRVDEQSRPHVELVMPDSGDVRVRVSGPITTSGDGLNGLFARGVFARGSGPWPIPGTARGDRFVFQGLALGRYRIAIGRGPSELGPSAADIELTEPGQVIELELRAPDSLAIAGTVVDGAGEPVPDAWVEAALVEPDFPIPYAVADPVLTDTEGRFQILDLPPGPYAVRASHPSGDAQSLDVAAGQRDVHLVVQGYGSLSGSVTDADGQPARDFSVLVWSETPGQGLHVDGDRGGWALHWIPPGNYRIVIMSPSGGVETGARVTSGNETKLALRLDPGLAGRAVLQARARRR